MCLYLYGSSLFHLCTLPLLSFIFEGINEVNMVTFVRSIKQRKVSPRGYLGVRKFDLNEKT